jgi:aminoglycoside 6'-N-acetyltransferase I
MTDRVIIRMLTEADLPLLLQADEDVFDEAVNPELAAEFLADPRHHMAAAILDGTIVGMASGVHYIHPDKPPALWINEVGVAERCRRQGIARRLIETLLDHASTIGCGEAWVATELDNTPARGLYRSTRGAEEEIVYYTYQLTGTRRQHES